MHYIQILDHSPDRAPVSLGEPAYAGIRASLSAFDQSDPINILTLRCLTLHLSGQVSSQAHGRHPPLESEWTPLLSVPALPPMLHPNAQLQLAIENFTLLITEMVVEEVSALIERALPAVAHEHSRDVAGKTHG